MVNIFFNKDPKEVYESVSFFKKLRRRFKFIRIFGLGVPSFYTGSYIVGGWLSITILPVSFLLFSKYFFRFDFKKSFELIWNGLKNVNLRSLDVNFDPYTDLPEMPSKPEPPEELLGKNIHSIDKINTILSIISKFVKPAGGAVDNHEYTRIFTHTLFENEDDIREKYNTAYNLETIINVYNKLDQDWSIYSLNSKAKKRFVEEIGEFVITQGFCLNSREDLIVTPAKRDVTPIGEIDREKFNEICKEYRDSFERLVKEYYVSYDSNVDKIKSDYENELKVYEDSLNDYMGKLAESKSYFSTLISLSSIVISVPILTYVNINGLTPKKALRKVLEYLNKYDKKVNSLISIFHELVYSKNGLKEIHTKLKSKNYDTSHLEKEYIKLQKKISKSIDEKLGFTDEGYMNFNIDFLDEIDKSQKNLLKKLRQVEKLNFAKDLAEQDMNYYEMNKVFQFFYAFQEIQKSFDNNKSIKKFDFLLDLMVTKAINFQEKDKDFDSKDFKRMEKWFRKVKSRIFKKIGKFDKYRSFFFIVSVKFEYLEEFLSLDNYASFIQFHEKLIKEKPFDLSEKSLLKGPPRTESSIYKML